MTLQMGYRIPEPNEGTSSTVTGEIEVNNDQGNPLPITVTDASLIIPVDRQAVYHAPGDNLPSQAVTAATPVVGALIRVFDKTYVDVFMNCDVPGTVSIEHSEDGVSFSPADSWPVDTGVSHLQFNCILEYARFSFTPDSNGTLSTFITKAVA